MWCQTPQCTECMSEHFEWSIKHYPKKMKLTQYFCMFSGSQAMGPNMEVPTFLPECEAANQGNIFEVPDLSTLLPRPWANKGKYKVGGVLCETQRVPDYQPHPACPR